MYYPRRGGRLWGVVEELHCFPPPLLFAFSNYLVETVFAAASVRSQRGTTLLSSVAKFPFPPLGGATEATHKKHINIGDPVLPEKQPMRAQRGGASLKQALLGFSVYMSGAASVWPTPVRNFDRPFFPETTANNSQRK